MFTVANGTLSFAVSCAHSSGADGPDREVAREQGREEHQLAREPDDRPDADHAGPVVVPVQAGGRDRGCSRAPRRHYVVSPGAGHPDPRCFGRVLTGTCAYAGRVRPTVLRARDAASATAPVRARAGSSPRGARPGPDGRHACGSPAPTSSACGGCTTAATAGRSGARQLRRRRDGRAASSRPRPGWAAYDTTLLSVHMVQHMVLSMVVPLFLALGAPVTLVLRTLPAAAAAAGCWRVLHSRVGDGADLPAADLPAVRDQPVGALLHRLVRRHAALAYLHELMHVHLVVVGSLFFWPLVGIDPVPGRVAYPFRLLLIVLTLPFHAFLGVTIMGQDDPDRRRLVPARCPMCLAARRRPPTSTSPAGSCGGPATWSGCCSSRCCSPSGCGRRCARREREDRRLDRLEAQAARARTPSR